MTAPTLAPATADNWRTFAACADTDPELFWPTSPTTIAGNAQIREALNVCRWCAVQPWCLDWALRHDTRNQVVGGRWFTAGGNPKVRPPDIARSTSLDRPKIAKRT